MEGIHKHDEKHRIASKTTAGHAKGMPRKQTQFRPVRTKVLPFLQLAVVPNGAG